MAGKPSAATERALARVKAGETPYAAAKAEGIALSTIYRAVRKPGETDPNGDAIFQWVLRWMAYPLQHPGAKMASAIIMHGPQGTGKSTVWQCLAKIYGDQRGLEDRFNSDWVDSKLFILAEEVVTRADYAYDVGATLGAICDRYGDKITAVAMNNISVNPSCMRVQLRHLDLSDFDIPAKPAGWRAGAPSSSFWLGYYHGRTTGR